MELREGGGVRKKYCKTGMVSKKEGKRERENKAETMNDWYVYISSL